MLKAWHKEDALDALAGRGWSGPLPLDGVSTFVGESCYFTRGDGELRLSFVADISTGFAGKKSVEAVWAYAGDSRKNHELWLHRARDSKWKKELFDWAEGISELKESPLPANGI